jgi:hypothetical protein
VAVVVFWKNNFLEFFLRVDFEGLTVRKPGNDMLVAFVEGVFEYTV